MEEAVEVHVDSAIAKAEVKKKGRKKKEMDVAGKKTQERTRKKAEAEAVAVDGESVTNPTEDHDGPGVDVSIFDYSVENHFKAIDMISKFCDEPGGDAFKETDIARFSSLITFLREWRYFNYKPKAIRFACETGSPPGKNVFSGTKLPQFSAATVPKERLSGETPSPESSKDFVLCVGGSVWALDWCPRIHQRSDCHIKCEFIAAAAHPPESSYHKIGTPLTGRGMIQIWCLLNVAAKEEEVPPSTNKPKRRPKSTAVIKDKSTQPKRPRGRPRKKPINENDVVCESQFVQALAVEFPKDSSQLHAMDGVSLNALEQAAQKGSSKKRKGFSQGASARNSSLTTSMQTRLKDKAKSGSGSDGVCLPLLTQNGDREAPATNLELNYSCGQDSMVSSENVSNNCSLEISPAGYSVPKDLALPRVVLCLAHNGKVAWDVKWRPCNVHNLECRARMGYLAVLLGNGSLEVWEVPSPHIIKFLYSSKEEGTDPRFVKLEPVFRCSKLNCGDRQSIPLTIEWSASFPHDLILAGCHDGTVALWKFCASDSSKDTRPFLCFSADTVPIRAVAWAPVESDPESANVIVTAGHEGLKFWDIRDPFRPLWDLNPVRRVIYSLDWLPDPRCVILSFDDGTLRILSLAKAAYDVPVTGKAFVGTQQQGLHSYYCTSFSIWSVQASRPTGVVAYCSADGSVLRFQLTNKAVEKDPLRNRAPHFLCGSLTEEESALTVNTPLPDTPFPMKKSLNEWGDTPRTIRGFLYQSNQAKRASDQKAKGQNSDNQALALFYGDDPGMESGSEDTLASLKSKQTLKSKTGGKKKLKDSRALATRAEGPENMQTKETEKGEAGNEIEVFPPKNVAMHRVRWNMNKGSERWLCYGGAAGILRCQEIAVSPVNKKSRAKR